MSDASGAGGKPVRQAAAVIGGFVTGFVLGDAGLASNFIGTIALAVGLATLAFGFVR